MPRQPKPWFWKQRGQWVVNIDRKRHYLGPDRKQAFEAFYALMRQPANRPRVSAESVAAIADAYLSWVEKHRSPDTYEWYRYRLERFCQRYPELTVGQIKPYHVQEWVDEYQIAKTTKRNYLRAVKRAFIWALKQGYIEANPIANLEVPSAEHREIVISEEEFERILQHAGHDSLRDLIIVTRETGCRPQESLRVEARHVDMVHKRWVFPISEAKGERVPRVVYLTDRAFEITQRAMSAYPSGKLFRNSAGGAWSPDAVNCAFDRIQRRMAKEEMNRRELVITKEQIAEFIPSLSPTKVALGKVVKKTQAELRHEAKRKLTERLARDLVPRYSLYAIRHSWATHALQRGVDAITVAVLMGHSDASTLARVYQHLTQNPEFMREQAVRAAKGA